MIMSKPGMRIQKHVKRPPKELIEQLRGNPSANISDCTNRMFAMNSKIKPMGRCSSLLGTAFTLKTAMADNLLFHQSLLMAQPGDIIVVDVSGDENYSVCGDIMFQIAISRKLAGIVIDGCIRDVAFLKEHDFPVFARGVTPRGPYKNGPGEINCDVCVGGQVIHPGDVIVGDDDGLVVIRPQDLNYILQNLQSVVDKEAEFNRLIEEGRWNESSLVSHITHIINTHNYENY